MKKIKIIVYMMLFLVLPGCGSKVPVISEINEKAQTADQFLSVAAYEFNSIHNGKLTIRVNDIYMWIYIRYADVANIVNISNATAKFVGYSIYDVSNNVSKSVYYFSDGTEKILHDGALPDTFIPYGDDDWEESSRGVAISEEKIKLELEGTEYLLGNNWNIIEGKYDLSGDKLKEHRLRLQINKLKGSFEMWINQEQLSVIEIYKDVEKQPQTLRRFWLDKDVSIDLDKISFDYLVEVYEKYYADAEFEKVL